VEGARGLVELVHEAGRADRDGQPGLLVELPHEVVGEARMRLHAAARRAKKVAPVSRVGVHEEEAVPDEEEAAHGDADGRPGHGRGPFHAARLA
jgi:hypothetical protein